VSSGLDRPDLVLASASGSRVAILRHAGLTITQDVAGVDEDAVKLSLRAEGADAAHVATSLADLKAQQVSRRHPDAFVIGADQMLECNGVWFDKPPDLDHARAHLMSLRGRTHDLITAAVVVRNGARVWQHVERATMTMRPLSDAFVDDYLATVGAEVCSTVGAYRLEGLGAQLFTRVEGDFFTILGLPLLPLLDFLRGHGIVAA
jgi:nucleoside triphosphate pyrophosphatase